MVHTAVQKLKIKNKGIFFKDPSRIALFRSVWVWFSLIQHGRNLSHTHLHFCIWWIQCLNCCVAWGHFRMRKNASKHPLCLQMNTLVTSLPNKNYTLTLFKRIWHLCSLFSIHDSILLASELNSPSIGISKTSLHQMVYSSTCFTQYPTSTFYFTHFGFFSVTRCLIAYHVWMDFAMSFDLFVVMKLYFFCVILIFHVSILLWVRHPTVSSGISSKKSKRN